MALQSLLSRGATAPVDSPLADFFEASLTRFERAACDMGGVRSRDHRIGGHGVRLHFAGRGLEPVVAPALAHLEAAASGRGQDQALSVYVWDGESPDTMPPAPPWSWTDGAPDGRIPATLISQRFRVYFAQPFCALSVLDLEANRALYWVRSTADVPSWVHGAPLLQLLHAWFAVRGLHVVHAACVGTHEGGLLIVGRGGSGKSTTALLCLEHGLHYVSDDYCLLDPGPPALAHALYCSGKLALGHIDRIPSMLSSVAIPAPDHQGKPLLLLRERHGIQLAESLPLRAVVAPRVGDSVQTRWLPLTQAAALRALAPSTLAQLPGAGSDALAAMAALVRALPCFELELGRDLSQIPAAIVSLLQRVSSDAHPAVV